MPKDKCPECLTEKREGARRCYACGEAFSNKSIQIIGASSSTIKIPTDKRKEDIIVIIIFSLLLIVFCSIGFGIFRYWDKIKSHFPKNNGFQYTCDISSKLREKYNQFTILCEKNDPKIRIQYKGKDVLILDGGKLLKKCSDNTTCSRENAEQLEYDATESGYILENNIGTKNPSLFILSFMYKPEEKQKQESLKNIFEAHSPNFGDSLYIDISGYAEPLILVYKIPPLSLDIYNNKYTKSITLGLGGETQKSAEFNYEKINSFFSKEQFEASLNTYLEQPYTANTNSANLFDYIEGSYEKFRNKKFEKFTNKYFSFYFNSYINFPYIKGVGGLDEESCLRSKKNAVIYNNNVDRAYKKCIDSGVEGCKKGGYTPWDYSVRYIGKITPQYPKNPAGNIISHLNLSLYSLDEVVDGACRREIQNALNAIKSNLISSN